MGRRWTKPSGDSTTTISCAGIAMVSRAYRIIRTCSITVRLRAPHSVMDKFMKGIPLAALASRPRSPSTTAKGTRLRSRLYSISVEVTQLRMARPSLTRSTPDPDDVDLTFRPVHQALVRRGRTFGTPRMAVYPRMAPTPATLCTDEYNRHMRNMEGATRLYNLHWGA